MRCGSGENESADHLQRQDLQEGDGVVQFALVNLIERVEEIRRNAESFLLAHNSKLRSKKASRCADAEIFAPS